MQKITSVVLALTVGVIAPACGNESDDASKQDLVEMVAERDELQSRLDDRSDRYEKTAAVVAGMRAVFDDPDSYGTEDEVADLLATFATSDALMADTVLGSAPMRQAWYNALYSGAVDAEVEISHQWITDDGSQSGSLWVWSGTNRLGNPFELVGVSLDSHNEDGLITREKVIYPYDDAYVKQAFSGDGTE